MTCCPAEGFDRLAPLYDLLMAPLEWGVFACRRRRLLALAHGRVLEVGVGTGINLAYYPAGIQLTGGDLSPAMLERARGRASRLGIPVTFVPLDATHLDFPDASFDTVVATLVFCSVEDPLQALRELSRVLVPGGQLLMLEHVQAERAWLRPLLSGLSRLTARAGEYFDRPTLSTVREAGFDLREVRRSFGGVVLELVAVRPEWPESR